MSRELEAILLDREGGAAQLLRRAVDWLIAHPASLVGIERNHTLNVLVETRPAMAPFVVLARRLREGHALQSIRMELDGLDENIGRRFVEVIGALRPCRLMTLSWSSSVLAGLKAAASNIASLDVLESLPGGEGKRLFLRAQSFLPSVSLHPDSALTRLAENVDAGVMGADIVFSDGAVLNKVLSAGMADALGRRQKPVYVLASSWKALGVPSASFRLAGHDAGLFEVVPAKLVTKSISERG